MTVDIALSVAMRLSTLFPGRRPSGPCKYLWGGHLAHCGYVDAEHEDQCVGVSIEVLADACRKKSSTASLSAITSR
jgi:hypothetical protein